MTFIHKLCDYKFIPSILGDQMQLNNSWVPNVKKKKK